MYISEEFQRKLTHRFDGRFRVRWSVASKEYHLEQKVGRAFWQTLPIDPADDGRVRQRDGYVLTARVRPGDRVGCKYCGTTLKVPVRAFKEVKCFSCGQSNSVLGYFPLDDLLLDYIQELERGVDAKAFDRENRDAVEARHKAASDAALYGFSNNWHRIRGNPRVGMYG